MAQRKIWAMEIAVVVLGLLGMVQQSSQVSLRNPLPVLPREIRNDEEPAFGLITSSRRVEKALNEADDFVANSYVDLLGRRFVIGTIHGSNVVFVRTSNRPSVHVGITVQILADRFNLRGIIHLGIAGATNESLSIGTVSVPGYIAFTGSWEWLSKDSKEQGQLDIGKFSQPQDSGSLLGSIKYNEIDIYYKSKIYRSYWIYADSRWLRTASWIKIDSGDVVVGLNASSSDVFVNNPAYAEFIFKNFGASTVDISSANSGLGAKSNSLRFIAFHGISNQAGRSTRWDSELASRNVANAAINFIWKETVPRSANEDIIDL